VFRCLSFVNVLCDADANAVKTAGVVITALELDECFFCSYGRRWSASIVIGAALKQSNKTTNTLVK
jgi:hypothetical protein